MNLLHFSRWLFHEARARYALWNDLRGRVGLGGGVHVVSPARLTVGSDVYLDRGSYLHCGDAAWCRGQGGIRIGQGSYVGPQAILFGMGEIEIGEYVMISPNVVVSSVQHPYDDTSKPMYQQPRVYGRVVIEDDVYLGSSCVVTPGVRIGRGSVIGAGAIVTHDIEPYSIAVGIPARVVGRRDRAGADDAGERLRWGAAAAPRQPGPGLGSEMTDRGATAPEVRSGRTRP